MNLFQLFQRSRSGEHQIKYVVKGDAPDYNITYKCGHNCKVVQDPHIHKGWKHKFVGHDGDYVYIAAQSNQPHSEVSVMIYEDGRLKERVSKMGDYPLVQVSGSI